VNDLKEFQNLESSSGIVLVAAAALALVIANSPIDHLYERFLSLRLVVSIEDLAIAKPLLLWINDGLMAVFFFLIGLEVKREVLEGELRQPAQILLPAVAAAGGFAVPAMVYLAFNWHDPTAASGWAIPAATDIAFALGVLALLGSRVPVALKVFLTSLAIFDDIAAIVVIAIFYTLDLSTLALALATAGYVVIFAMNRLGVVSVAAYILVGAFIWVCVLKSGVHATLAGFVVALAIPMRSEKEAYEGSPLRHLEHTLHPWVAFMILPLFAFANAGVSFRGLTPGSLVDSVSIGIAAGLFIGKQVGVMTAAWLAIRLGLARLPEGATWASLYGVALLTGIGFTMSLFIGTLAFEAAGPIYDAQIRAAVLIGSITSALAGFLLLRATLPEAG